MIPLYGASILTIGMLAMFARHNRKSGWKKQRSSFSHFVGDYYEESAQSNASAWTEAEPAVPSWTPVTAAETIGFSAQLLNLRTALGTAGAAPQLEAAPQALELVRK